MAQCQENLSEMAPEFLPPGLREGDSRSDHIGGRDICGLDEGTNGYTENTMKISSPHMKLEGSEHPVLAVGEIRQNLDCLKASVLGYYSRLYTDSGKSIEERLDRLSADYCRTRVPRVPPFASQLGNTNPRRVKIDSHSPDATSQFTSRSTRGKHWNWCVVFFSNALNVKYLMSLARYSAYCYFFAWVLARLQL